MYLPKTIIINGTRYITPTHLKFSGDRYSGSKSVTTKDYFSIINHRNGYQTSEITHSAGNFSASGRCGKIETCTPLWTAKIDPGSNEHKPGTLKTLPTRLIIAAIVKALHSEQTHPSTHATTATQRRPVITPTKQQGWLLNLLRGCMNDSAD